MHLIDTHCHLSHFPEKDRESIVQRAQKANVKKLITVACSLKEINDCLKLADKYDYIWAGIGMHPTKLGKDSDKNLKQLYELAKNNSKVIAIGETGLDYYHDTEPRELQAMYFKKQIDIAKDLNKPVILHCRGGKNPGDNEEVFIDMIRILDKENFNNAVVHCFSGNRTEAEKIIDLGLMVSFTGILTYKNNEELRDVVRDIPLDKIMLETDAPYISVAGKRDRSGEPAFVSYIAQAIADAKNVPIEEVVRITTDNAERFFGI